MSAFRPFEPPIHLLLHIPSLPHQLSPLLKQRKLLLFKLLIFNPPRHPPLSLDKGGVIFSFRLLIHLSAFIILRLSFNQPKKTLGSEFPKGNENFADKLKTSAKD